MILDSPKIVIVCEYKLQCLMYVHTTSVQMRNFKFLGDLISKHWRIVVNVGISSRKGSTLQSALQLPAGPVHAENAQVTPI